MELTQQQYEYLKDLLPRQRENVKVDNRRVLSAILYIEPAVHFHWQSSSLPSLGSYVLQQSIRISTVQHVRSYLFATTRVATPWSVYDCSIQQATRRRGTAAKVNKRTI